jgi:hypothetical protein
MDEGPGRSAPGDCAKADPAASTAAAAMPAIIKASVFISTSNFRQQKSPLLRALERPDLTQVFHKALIL